MHPDCVVGAGVFRAKEEISRPAPATQVLSIIDVLIPKYFQKFHCFASTGLVYP